LGVGAPGACGGLDETAAGLAGNSPRRANPGVTAATAFNISRLVMRPFFMTDLLSGRKVFA
jgi:hypothetical protein